MQTRDRVENIERMHEQLLVSEKTFKDRIEGKPEEPPVQAAPAEAASKGGQKKEEEASKAEEKTEEPKEVISNKLVHARCFVYNKRKYHFFCQLTLFFAWTNMSPPCCSRLTNPRTPD